MKFFHAGRCDDKNGRISTPLDYKEESKTDGKANRVKQRQGDRRKESARTGETYSRGRGKERIYIAI